MNYKTNSEFEEYASFSEYDLTDEIVLMQSRDPDRIREALRRQPLNFTMTRKMPKPGHYFDFVEVDISPLAYQCSVKPKVKCIKTLIKHGHPTQENLNLALKWAVITNSRYSVNTLVRSGANPQSITEREFKRFNRGAGVKPAIAKVLCDAGFFCDDIIPHIILEDIRDDLRKFHIRFSSRRESIHITTISRLSVDIVVVIENKSIEVKSHKVHHRFHLSDPDYKKKILLFCMMCDKFSKRLNQIVSSW